MTIYFASWRRKLGVLTLGMLLLLPVWWVSSLGREHTTPTVMPPFDLPEFNNGRVEYWPTTIRLANTEGSDRAESDTGLNGKFVFTQDQLAWSIPCWSTAVPLILLSCWLFMSQSRSLGKQTAKQIS